MRDIKTAARHFAAWHNARVADRAVFDAGRAPPDDGDLEYDINTARDFVIDIATDTTTTE
jgi:hypothetical protein